MGKGYERFKKCITRAQESKSTLIIICEDSLSSVEAGCEYSQIRGESMARKLFTLWVRHGVQTVFTNGRYEMARYIERFYEAVGKQYVRSKKGI